MALPGDVTTFTLTFGPYTDGQGAAALAAGTTAKLFPVDPSTNRRLRLDHAASGQRIVPVDVPVTILDDGTATVAGLPHTGQAPLTPVGWAWRIEWNLTSTNPAHPGNLTFVVASGSVVDFDLLAPAATVPPVSLTSPTVFSVAGFTGTVTATQLATGLDTAGNRLSDAALRAAYVPFWESAETVTAGTIRMAPDGKTISRIADGTTRATYDATEQAAWTVVSSGGITPGVAVGQIPVWDGDSYEPQTPTEATAADIPVTPVGQVSAVTVQAAIAELDTEKAAAGHTHPPAGISVQDENGTAITGVTQIDFQGAGVSATAGTGEVVVTIPGGGTATASRNPHPQAQNLKGWNFDPLAIAATVGAGAIDTLYLEKVLVPESVSISNVLFVIGTTPTTDVAGFYTVVVLPDGTVTRVSGDLAATVNATPANTLVTGALSSPVTVGGGGATDFVYVGFGYDSVTTQPNFMAAPGSAGQNAAMNAGLAVGTRRHGTLANTVWPPTGPLTLASMAQAATPKNFWVAVS